MGVLKRILGFPNFWEAYGGFGIRSGPPEFSESLWGIELTRNPRRLPSPRGGVAYSSGARGINDKGLTLTGNDIGIWAAKTPEPIGRRGW